MYFQTYLPPTKEFLYLLDENKKRFVPSGVISVYFLE